MKATLMYGAGDVRVGDAPEPTLQLGTDALDRVVRRGVHAALEAVGHLPAHEQSFGVVRPGGLISRVGVPQYEQAPIGFGSLFGKNARLAGGPAPVGAYLEDALGQVVAGDLDPGKVFDRTVGFDGIPDAYAAMDSRESLKVMVSPDTEPTSTSH